MKGLASWSSDRDEDGYGDDQTQQLRCDVVPGFSAVGGDCDDLNDSINPDSARCDLWTTTAMGPLMR